MRFPGKISRWGAQWVNLEAWHSSVIRKSWQKSTTSWRSSQDRTPPRKFKWRSSTMFSSTQFLMDGPSNPTYRVGILIWRPIGKPVQCSRAWKFLNRYTKGVHLLKYPQGRYQPWWQCQEANGEDKPPLLLTPRRAALASARQKMQAIRVMFPPEKKYILVAWTWKLFRRV